MEFCISLKKYRQFSECCIEKIIEEVYNYITMKRINNNTADMLLHAFTNIYQTKVIVIMLEQTLLTLSAIVTIRQFIFVKMRTPTTFKM